MVYFLLIILALLPSAIWLLFYLRKDAHPESNRMVLKIFFYGFLVSIPAILIELGFHRFLSGLTSQAQAAKWWVREVSPFLISLFYIFIGIALVEEALKYLVVKYKVLGHSELDEPLDIMLYMIISALGFAAAENVLFFSPLGQGIRLDEILALSFLRFIGATFLHALSSGIMGFFLALSLFETKKRLKLLITGLGIATLLHGLYNFSIMKLEGNIRFLIPLLILIILAFAVSLGFQKLKKMASICKIK